MKKKRTYTERLSGNNCKGSRMEEWKKVLPQNQDQRRNLVARGHRGFPGGCDWGRKDSGRYGRAIREKVGWNWGRVWSLAKV